MQNSEERFETFYDTFQNVSIHKLLLKSSWAYETSYRNTLCGSEYNVTVYLVMSSSNVCPKSSQTCYSCAKQGVTSKLVQFHVNFEEAILLCINQGCLYPLGSGDVARFIIQNRIKEKSASEVESKFKRPVYNTSIESENTSNGKPRKSRHHFLAFKNATEERRQNSATASQLIQEMFNTSGVPPYSVQKDKESISRLRSEKTVFEPYIPKKRSCYSLLSGDNACNKECMQLPVDLEQSYKELSDSEEKFVVDILLNRKIP